ncbi:aminopeptidase P N-terminal domain-containing protein, partial [Idiomarina abyssalis]|uniref:aminopeptidase P N-terminal domain-containing protein n=3 Tax=Idiomarinaceae TaxID=267893 RepID=UPI00241D1FCF
MRNVIPQDEFKQRRRQLLESLPPHSVALVAANSEVTRSNDTEYPFRQNSDFFYLTGFNEPDAVLLLINDGNPRSVLFCQDKDLKHEVWHGLRLGYTNAVEALAIDSAEDLDTLPERLPELLEGIESVFYPMGEDSVLAELVSEA